MPWHKKSCLHANDSNVLATITIRVVPLLVVVDNLWLSICRGAPVDSIVGWPRRCLERLATVPAQNSAEQRLVGDSRLFFASEPVQEDPRGDRHIQ